VNAGHPLNERLGILIRAATFARVHPGKELIPLLQEVKRKVKLTPPNQAFIIYTPVTIVRVRASPSFVLWHG